VLLVHCGSRGYGESICQAYTASQGTAGAGPESEAAAAYLHAHNLALRWARASRELVARRFLEALKSEGELVWDGCHNSIVSKHIHGRTVWVHRKGAVPADAGPVVIPGSRGSLSYVVKPIGDGQTHAWSLAHGAGRKWSRSESRLQARERYRVADLVHTPLGGRVVCEQRDLLYEEAPLAYKPVERVIQGLEEAGLIQVIATLRPLLTYKTRAARR
jgi:release factor H-coupled RctB family protein